MIELHAVQLDSQEPNVEVSQDMSKGVMQLEGSCCAAAA